MIIPGENYQQHSLLCISVLLESFFKLKLESRRIFSQFLIGFNRFRFSFGKSWLKPPNHSVSGLAKKGSNQTKPNFPNTREDMTQVETIDHMFPTSEKEEFTNFHFFYLISLSNLWFLIFTWLLNSKVSPKLFKCIKVSVKLLSTLKKAKSRSELFKCIKSC